MIVPDVNLLVYARNTGCPEHDAALEWWESAVNGIEHIGFGWPVLTGYLRITTNPRVLPAPLDITSAVADVEEWLRLPRVRILEPGIEHLHVMERMLAGAGRAGDLVPDAHLAALAFEHGGTVYSSDADFARFPLSRWVDPLA